MTAGYRSWMSLAVQNQVAHARHEANTEGEKQLCESWVRMFPDKQKSAIELRAVDDDNE